MLKIPTNLYGSESIKRWLCYANKTITCLRQPGNSLTMKKIISAELDKYEQVTTSATLYEVLKGGSTTATDPQGSSWQTVGSPVLGSLVSKDQIF